MKPDRSRTLIVLGSGPLLNDPEQGVCIFPSSLFNRLMSAGGHTAEMLTLVKGLDGARYYPRCYVAAATDRLGLQKAQQAEADNGTGS